MYIGMHRYVCIPTRLADDISLETLLDVEVKTTTSVLLYIYICMYIAEVIRIFPTLSFYRGSQENIVDG